MFCQECGTQIRTQAKFCNRCGNEVRQRFGEEHNQTITLMQMPPPPKLSSSPGSKSSGSNPSGAKSSAPAVPPPTDRQPLSKHSWSRAEDAIVMPAIGKNAKQNAEDGKSGEKKAPEKKPGDKPLPGSAPLPADTSERMKVRFDLMKPDTSDAENAPNTGQINSAGDPIVAPPKPAAAAHVAPIPRQDPNLAPFFTQVGTAIPNRQHTRLILAVPLLLVVAVLLLVLAYIVNK